MADTGLPSQAPQDTTADALTSSPVPDHPDGAEIRRQVEYYFSDENLPTDRHLLQFCRGRENLPVSINRICGFARMRQYKPRKLVVAALRLSTFLEVSDDGKTIKRKVPLQGKCILDPDFFDDEDIAYDPRTQKAFAQKRVQPALSLLEQRKAANPGVSKNMLKPTGFERTYMEPVLTPDEAAQEDEMYDPDKHFVERIEIAIQRFKQKRRMQPRYAHVFENLMQLGGVESGPRMYQGLSTEEMKDMDAEELARALATHHVPWDRSDKSRWEVDFVGVCKAFLSSWYPAHYGYTSDTIKNACQVPRSFFRYLRFHRVCPEYDDQLATALEICDTAEDQLPRINAIILAFPGDFNKSASVVFGGTQAGVYIGDQSWAKELGKEGMKIEEIGMREEEAKIKFGTGLAVLGTNEQFSLYESSSMRVIGSDSAYLEVVAVQLPDADSKAAYAAQNTVYKRKLELKCLGKLTCKTWYLDDCDEYDLPRDNGKYPEGKPREAREGQMYEFWIEEDILSGCFVGMKMNAGILVLSGGLSILDNVKETMCSFHVWLPNELWMERKPKEVRWLKKGMGLDDDEEEAEADSEARTMTDRPGSDGEFDDE